MLTTRATYKNVFDTAIKKKQLSKVKRLLAKFNVVGSDSFLHNLALSVITKPSLERNYYKPVVEKAVKVMAKTPYCDSP